MEEFATEFEFDLPKGYIDSAGTLHKHGVMRLATAADEILPLRDPRVVQNPGYLTIILLARVITSLGTLPKIDPRVIERLFSSDLAFCRTCTSASTRPSPSPRRACAPSAATSSSSR